MVTLLTANYSTQDSVVPTISKIYTQAKNKEPQPNEDFIYVYSQNTSTESIGIGQTTKANVTESIKIDIRSRPANTHQSNMVNDVHARKVLTEVMSVLFENISNPDSNFNLIDPIIDVVDLSNGSKGIFRYVLTVNLIAYCRDLTA